MLKYHNNKLQQGFTLIEILIVIAIITALIGISSLSINLARPSPGQLLSEKIKTKIVLSKKFAQNYNKPTKIFIDYENKKILFSWLSEKDEWNINKNIQELTFKDFDIISDLQTINIMPNGFTNESTIIISKDEDSWTINIGKEEE